MANTIILSYTPPLLVLLVGDIVTLELIRVEVVTVTLIISITDDVTGTITQHRWRKKGIIHTKRHNTIIIIRQNYQHIHITVLVVDPFPIIFSPKPVTV